MTTADLQLPSAPSSARTAGARRRLALRVTDSQDVLLRILIVLRRRGCTVTHVDYAAADRHRPGHLVIGVEAPAGRAHCVDRWLANLVEVIAVD
jgi:acetolactate synthase regulatory subunit